MEIKDSVTVGIVNFNGKAALPETLRSVTNLDYPGVEIILVDNHSTDGSCEWVQENFPNIRLVRLDANRGLPGARNVILQKASSDYVFIMDNDISVQPDILGHLMKAMKSVPDAGACHPEVQDPDDPLAYRYNGGWIHYLCALVSRTPPDNSQERPAHEVFDTVSGGALLIDRKAACNVGYFDEDYFFNWEDGDFTTRLTLAGYRCLNVPAAVVYHRSKPRGTSRVFYQTRNRLFYMLKLYSWRTLLLTAPMLFLFELSQMAFLLYKGAAKDYWRGNLAAMRLLPKTLKKREAFQRMKVVRDRDWLRGGEFYVPGELLGGKVIETLIRAFTALSDAYWKAVRPLC